MKRIPLIYIIIISILGCKSKAYDGNSIKVICFNNKPIELIQMSDFVSSINYVPLETKSNCNINNITKIKFFGDSILIFNQIGLGFTDILVFDKSGKFLDTFGQSGPGPEEIDSPRDIVKFGESFLIWDRKKISEFDKKGKFVRKLLNAFTFGRNFFLDSNYILLYHGTELPGILSQYNLDGRLVNTFKPPEPKQISSTFGTENLFHVNGEYHMFSPSFDTVWTYSKSKLLPKYILDFGDDLTLQKLFNKYKETTPPQFLNVLNSNIFSNVDLFYESDDYIFLSYSKLKQQRKKLISKRNNRQLDFIFCNNNIDNGMFKAPISLFGDTLVILLEPIKILNQIKKNNSSAKTEFYKLGKSINQDDNPVLMFCKLK
jgi:hypothetical protein